MSNRAQVSIAVVGGYGVALIFGVRRAPGPGETVLAGSIGVDHGGKGSNQAVAARRLGAEVALLTAAGPTLLVPWAVRSGRTKGSTLAT